MPWRAGWRRRQRAIWPPSSGLPGRSGASKARWSTPGATPITNAVVEGTHPRVKALTRRASGERNDRRVQLRILNCFHTD